MAAETPSTTGAEVASRISRSSPAMPPQPRTMTSARSSCTAHLAWSTMAATARSGDSSSSSTVRPLARTEAQWDARPARSSLSSISGTVRSSVVTTE